jgi:hypothetical protein
LTPAQIVGHLGIAKERDGATVDRGVIRCCGRSSPPGLYRDAKAVPRFERGLVGDETMTTIHWAWGVNSDWATAGDRASDVAPGATPSVSTDPMGSYPVPIDSAGAALALTVNDTGARVADNHNLTLGTTLAVKAGMLEMNGGGDVAGGTLGTTGRTYGWNGGSLSRVTYDGTLDLSPQNSYLYTTVNQPATSDTAAGLANEFFQVFDNLAAVGGAVANMASLLSDFAKVAEEAKGITNFSTTFVDDLGEDFGAIGFIVDTGQTIVNIKNSNGDPGAIAAQIYGFSVDLCFQFLSSRTGLSFLSQAAIGAAETIFDNAIRDPAMAEVQYLVDSFLRKIPALLNFEWVTLGEAWRA